MFILLIYLVATITWGWVLFDLIKATVYSIKNNTDTPHLLIPLAASSFSLFLESTYFLIANFYKYVMVNQDIYQLFVQQEELSLIKIFIAFSGLMMLLKLKREEKERDYYDRK